MNAKRDQRKPPLRHNGGTLGAAHLCSAVSCQPTNYRWVTANCGTNGHVLAAARSHCICGSNTSHARPQCAVRLSQTQLGRLGTAERSVEAFLT